MKSHKKLSESFEEIDRLAHDTSDIRPLSASMRRDWEAARKTGKAFAHGASEEGSVGFQIEDRSHLD